MTPKNWTLQDKNRMLGGRGGQKSSKIVENFRKSSDIIYVRSLINIWGFLTFAITFSTERNQKLSFSDPPSSSFVIA